MRFVAALAASRASVADSTTIQAWADWLDRSAVNQWSAECVMLLQPEAQCRVDGTLDPVDTDLPIALRSVGVARGKRVLRIQHWQIERRARA